VNMSKIQEVLRHMFMSYNKNNITKKRFLYVNNILNIHDYV